MISRPLYLILLWHLLTQHRTAAQSINIRTLQSNECEHTTSDGHTVYYACLGEPIHLLRSGNSKFNLTVEPSGSTCGSPAETFCTLGLRECDICDDNDATKRHPPEYMLDQKSDSSNTDTWWQSVTWSKYPEPLEVNITISFDKSYELQSDLSIRFQSSRPRSMILEKSTDFGQTWSTLQYYNKFCKMHYDQGIASSVPSSGPDTVVCSQEYSNELPFSGGMVVFPVVEDRFRHFLGKYLSHYQRLYEALNSTNLKSFLTFTNLRIRLMYPATDGKEYLQKRMDLLRYYYAISDIKVIAGCSCNLHAKYCDVINNSTVCLCEHNTEGANCERCKPLYNEQPWEPGYYVPYPSGTANECRKCECHSHATSCTYNEVHGRGVCDTCTDNTTGLHCDRCLDGFYHHPSLLLDHPDTCKPCDCEVLGIEDFDQRCTDTGQCNCRALVTGHKCDRCIAGYYGLLLQGNQPGTCKPCNCVLEGTVGADYECDLNTGQCPCKATIGQQDCGQCNKGFYHFPTDQWTSEHGCLECGCDVGGSLGLSCDKVTGQCHCQPHIEGRRCNSPRGGYFIPISDANQYHPVEGTCQIDALMLSEGNAFKGHIFASCRETESVTFDTVEGDTIDHLTEQSSNVGFYFPAVRYSLDTSGPRTLAALLVDVTGSSGSVVNAADGQHGELDCPVHTAGATYRFNLTSLVPGIDYSWISEVKLPVDKRCTYRVTFTAGHVDGSSGQIRVDSLVLVPALSESQSLQLANASQLWTYRDCVRKIISVSTRDETLTHTTCSSLFFSVAALMGGGARACDCDPMGNEVTAGGCHPIGGQCHCKPGVQGRVCDHCIPGYYNFSDTGCTACHCSDPGSSSPVCDYLTGQCPCRRNVASAGVTNMLSLPADLQCRVCLYRFYGLSSGLGCSRCNCSSVGAQSSQCSDDGHCFCKPTIGGAKCDRCQLGYFNFTGAGCKQCNCTKAGSENRGCGETTGQCYCKANVQGMKCEQCRATTFNLAASNPSGCQACFCHGHSHQCGPASGFTGFEIHSVSTRNWTQTMDGSHVSATAGFLGNQQRSYGQLVRFLVKSTQVSVLLSGQSAVIMQGNGQSVYFSVDNVTAVVDTHREVAVLLHETSWHYNETSQPSSFSFYAILADLRAIHIRRLYPGGMVTVKDVRLSTARQTDTASTWVTFVENCTCEDGRNVLGPSCSSCNTGYRRSSVNGSTYDTCTACDCSKRSETTPPVCDEDSGECLNCRNGTQGLRCSECSAHVYGAECDACELGFWGLGSNGCQACNCSMPGATDTVCDSQTGQCDCVSHVTGRTCDVCVENYVNLTSAGCTRCEACYDLVMRQVEDVRAMRHNLTSLLNVLLSHDLSAELGPFHERLDRVLTDTQRLLIYLAETQRVNTTVATQISRLNATLQYLTETLDNSTDLAINHSNTSLQMADSELAAARDVAQDINDTLSRLVPVRADVWQLYLGQIQQLVDSLNYVEHTLVDMSQSSMGNMLRTASIVQNIVSESTTALDIARTARNMTTASYRIHDNTTQRIGDLEDFAAIVTNKSKQVAMESESCVRNVSLAWQVAIATRQNVTNVGDVDTDVVEELEKETEDLRNEAYRLNIKALTLTTNSQSVRRDVRGAGQRMTNILAEVSALKNQSEGLYVRSVTASQNAVAAEQLGNLCFKNASIMLDIMRDFASRAAAVELKANRSLLTVARVRAVSEEATLAADRLKQSLKGTRLMSSDARLYALQAKDGVIYETQLLATAVNSSQQLKMYSDTVLNDVMSMARTVDAINASDVAPAAAQCASIRPELSALQTKVTQADKLANEALRRVNATQQRIEAIITDLHQVGNIDRSKVMELQQLMAQIRANFDQRLLGGTVKQLLAAVANQRQWLEAMHAKKQSLQRQIRSMRDLHEQLRP